MVDDVVHGRHPVPPHVASQGLPDRELEPAHRALVGLGLRRRSGPGGLVVVGMVQPWLRVAGPVAPQGLEGGELAVAGLALKDPAMRRVACSRVDIRAVGERNQAVRHGDAFEKLGFAYASLHQHQQIVFFGIASSKVTPASWFQFKRELDYKDRLGRREHKRRWGEDNETEERFRSSKFYFIHRRLES